MTRHVVLVHRYFAPDTPPYASILADIAKHLGGNGWQVTVLTCQPSYNRAVVSRAPAREQVGEQVQVVRYPVLDDRTSGIKKALNLAWFCARLLASARRLGPVDAMMAASTPPVLVAAVVRGIARRKRAAFVYHKQDVYPEVTVGLSRDLGRFDRLLRRLDSRTDKVADRVVVLSRDMATTVAERGVDPSSIVSINNFDPWRVKGEVERNDRVDDPILNVVFAGNLGRFQGLETVFLAMQELRDDPVQFHFFGEGALKDHLQQLVAAESLDRVEVYGYRPPDEVARFLATVAGLGIVSLAPGVIRAAYPSKTLSYLRQGTPILALVEGDSELAEIVRDEKVGIQVEPGDVEGLVAALRATAADPTLLAEAPALISDLFTREFSREARLAQWGSLFAQVTR